MISLTKELQRATRCRHDRSRLHELGQSSSSVSYSCLSGRLQVQRERLHLILQQLALSDACMSICNHDCLYCVSQCMVCCAGAMV